ncbi:MAG: SRPBCC family protein [Deltaproteobacteria bacterium]|nr:SRPBCC family protein [Deltaproteobacteria bacterium]
MSADALKQRPPLARRAFPVAAPVETVYAFITRHEDLGLWLPLVRSVDVDHRRAGTDGVGTLRTLNRGTAGEARETVTAASPPTLFAYSADDASLHGLIVGHVSVFRLAAEGPQRTRVDWAITGRAAPGLRGLFARLGMALFIRVAARRLRRRFAR